MTMTPADFRHLCLMKGIMASDSVLEAVFADVQKAFAKAPPIGKDVQAFIGEYCSAFKRRYGTNPLVGGKDAGFAKRVVKDHGSAKACELIQTYLEMNDQFFQTKRHDLATFAGSLNAVVVKHQTGQGVSRLQAQSRENLDANKAAMTQYLEKKGKR